MKLSYELGEEVTLTATPIAPNVFNGWAGDLPSTTTNPATFTMNGNKTVQARFASTVPFPPGLVAFWRGETDATDLNRWASRSVLRRNRRRAAKRHTIWKGRRRF